MYFRIYLVISKFFGVLVHICIISSLLQAFGTEQLSFLAMQRLVEATQTIKYAPYVLCNHFHIFQTYSCTVLTAVSLR